LGPTNSAQGFVLWDKDTTFQVGVVTHASIGDLENLKVYGSQENTIEEKQQMCRIHRLQYYIAGA
jgi:hypothetical protein